MVGVEIHAVERFICSLGLAVHAIFLFTAENQSHKQNCSEESEKEKASANQSPVTICINLREI